MPADLIVDNVTKQFATRSEPLIVLRGCSFELSAGQNLAILGPSGSGKSTLLYIIGTLDTASSGRIVLGGQETAGLDEPGLAQLRNQRIGFVFQDHHLLPQCSVLENVLLPTMAGTTTSPLRLHATKGAIVADGPTRANRGTDADNLARAKMLLERVGLSHRTDHRPAELSGGERQRAAIARALIRRPALLLADEPTGNLDRTNATGIGQLLLELSRSEQMMLIVVTHSQELASLFERRMEIDDGRLEVR